MDVSTITAIAGGVAVVLRAVAVLVTALRSRREARRDEEAAASMPV